MRVFALLFFAFVFASPAQAERTIGFAAAAGNADALIVAVDTSLDLGAATAVMSEAAAANFERAVEATYFTGAVGEMASYFIGDAAIQDVHLVGVAPDTMRSRDWADFGGRVGRLAKSSKATRIAVIAPGAESNDAAQAAAGAIMGAYSFDRYKSARPAYANGDLIFVTENADAARALFNGQTRHLAEAVNWTRDMQSEPANVLYPEEFVRRAQALLRGVGRVTISVLNERQMERLGMNAHLAVGRGSVRPPRVLIMEYRGGAAGAAPIVFAGKGITFDTGGISIKPNLGMWKMKADMTGAAAVTATIASLAKSEAPVNVVAIAALAENMPSGNAQRPGDVWRSMSGKTIEIMSTDAEGRLVLADAVWYAQQEYNPALLVNVATLTGSVGRALGDEYAGLFARDDAIADRLLALGAASGDDLWRLPLHPNHNRQIESVIADVKNGDTGAPGASTAAAFIGAFVKEETPWAHLDIAGVDWLDEATPTTPAGASGFSVRVLDRLAREGVN